MARRPAERGKLYRTADAQVFAWSISCPECGKTVGNPFDGSAGWPAKQSTVYAAIYECDSCGMGFKLPRKVAPRNI